MDTLNGTTLSDVVNASTTTSTAATTTTAEDTTTSTEATMATSTKSGGVNASDVVTVNSVDFREAISFSRDTVAACPFANQTMSVTVLNISCADGITPNATLFSGFQPILFGPVMTGVEIPAICGRNGFFLAAVDATIRITCS